MSLKNKTLKQNNDIYKAQNIIKVSKNFSLNSIQIIEWMIGVNIPHTIIINEMLNATKQSKSPLSEIQIKKTISDVMWKRGDYI